jgi:hypothetical protein
VGALSQLARAALAVGCVVVGAVTAGCTTGSSSGSTPAGTSTIAAPTPTVDNPSIPGIGATRHDWDASHRRNPTFNNDAVYGYDPSLPEHLAASGAVYVEVMGSQTIQDYVLNMHEVDRDEALARVRQELPADATVKWDLTLDQCYRVQYYSPTLPGIQHMALVELEDLQEGGTLAFSPRMFNQASFDLDGAGPKPDPDQGC